MRPDPMDPSGPVGLADLVRQMMDTHSVLTDQIEQWTGKPGSFTESDYPAHRATSNRFMCSQIWMLPNSEGVLTSHGFRLTLEDGIKFKSAVDVWSHGYSASFAVTPADWDRVKDVAVEILPGAMRVRGRSGTARRLPDAKLTE